MKYLKISNNQGYYVKDTNHIEIDKIGKDDLLYLLNQAIDDDEFEMDEFTEESIRNKAHKIIYKNIYGKLKEVLDNRTRFRDESRSIYKEAFEKYRTEE